MRLYHGTSIRNWDFIRLSGELKPAEHGDQHVSFSTCPEVAAYFANLSWAVYDGDGIGMIILETHTGALDRHGLVAEPFSSAVWGEGQCDWEKEYAVSKPVPLSIIRVYSKFGPIATRPPIDFEAKR